MMAIGFLRLGTYIKFIPYPVTIGFTAGIAAIIFASQIKDLLGLTLTHEPADFVPKVEAIARRAGSVHARPCCSRACVAAASRLCALRPSWPAF